MSPRFARQSLLAATVITVGTNVFGRILGYAREATIAGYFGTSSIFDIFLLAFTIPELLTFVAFAALPPAFIPLKKKLGGDDEEAGRRLFVAGTVTFTAIFGLVAVAIYVLKAPIINLLAPRLTGEDCATALRLMSILAWFVFFRGMEAYFRAVLFDRKHFVVPAFSPMVANLLVLGIVLFGYDQLNIDALAYGWLAASIALFVINGATAYRLVNPSTSSGVDMGIAGKLMKSVLAVAAVECIALAYPLVDRYLAAAYLGEGQIAALRYATFLIMLPVGMFVVSAAAASFPWISDFNSDANGKRLHEMFAGGLRLVMFVMGLMALSFYLFPLEIVRIAFQRGAFDSQSLVLTADPLRYFALGICFYSMLWFQMRFYYARSNLLRVGTILFVVLVVKILLSVFLIGPMEQNGLALASSIAWLVGFIIMTIDLQRLMGFSLGRMFGLALVKIMASLLVTALLWFGLIALWPGSMSWPLLLVAIRLALLGGVGAIVYMSLATVMNLPEPKKLLELVRSKLKFNSR
ncbi:MAG: polysaccharide biosynthesis C-terminal domain-containing protein [candidate division Zixibacteria bacterium]|nr:polysaccharide biosynthesis C-terminal domain-containing protein [candidate division Zixibacteria bacterium]